MVHSEGQSLREFDEKLQSLQKENFNLKLRIFFLEERKEATSQNGGGSGVNGSNGTTAKSNDEDVAKYNIDLKVHFPFVFEYRYLIFNVLHRSFNLSRYTFLCM